METYCGLVTLTTLDDVLISFSRNIYHRLTNSAGDHWHAALDGGLIRRWQLIRANRRNGVHIGLCFVCNDKRDNDILLAAILGRERVLASERSARTAAYRTADRIVAMRAVRDVLVLQQRLPLALLAVSHVERRWDQLTATARRTRFASIV